MDSLKFEDMETMMVSSQLSRITSLNSAQKSYTILDNLDLSIVSYHEPFLHQNASGF